MRGIPYPSMNALGAAPVPPSAPSMAMKSGNVSWAFISRTISWKSEIFPRQSLIPTGMVQASWTFLMNATVVFLQVHSMW